MTKSSADNHPLSYSDARRWLGLVVLLLLGAAAVWALQSILLLYAIVFLLAMVLNPVIAGLEKCGLKRPLAVGFLLVLLLALLAVALWFVIPPVLDQAGELVARTPQYADRLQSQVQTFAARYPVLRHALPEANDLLSAAGSQAGGVAKFLLRSTYGVAGGVIGAVVALLLLVFVLSNPKPLVAGFLELMPDRHRDPARRSLVRLMNQMRAWAHGVLINGSITGVSTGLLMWAVGVQPALVFGALAFCGEFVPNIGPVIVALPALFVALSMGAKTFWLALAAILFVQQIETNVLVPFILGKEMNLNPVAILFFTLAMGSLFGFAGAILAVPAAALAKILISEFYLAPRQLDRSAIDKQAQRIVSNESTANG